MPNDVILSLSKDGAPSRRAVIAGAFAAAAAARIAPANAQTDAMKALIAAAKAEGAVVVDWSADRYRARKTIVAGLSSGIRHSGDRTSAAAPSASGPRVRAERAAGKYLLDVLVSGSDTPTLTYLPAGWLDKSRAGR